MPEPASAPAVAPPNSPCVLTCALDATGHCMGCLRTREEIAGWSCMSARERWQVIERLAARRAARRGTSD